MNINTKATSVSMSPAISDYLDKRLEKIATIVGDDTSVQCDVELARSSSRHQKGDVFRAEIHIVGAGRNVYASSEKQDLYAAIDEVRDEIIRKLTAGKAKRISLIRRSGSRVKDMVKGLWSRS